LSGEDAGLNNPARVVYLYEQMTHDEGGTQPRPRRDWLIAGTLFVTAVLVGLGGFTFGYAKGFSYLSPDPRACANCHIMQPQFDSWQKSSHHTVAVCIDCHLPHSFVGKYVAKAENGWNHSVAFTLQNFPEPIRITPKNAAILQASCVNCHQSVASAMLHGGETACVRCHAAVGHGERVGLGPSLTRSGGE
jgi:cytochrome c nitrite reductase small subunit